MLHPRISTLIALVDRELPEANVPRVASHVRRCGRCRQRVETLQAFATEAAAPPEPTPELKWRVMSQLGDVRPNRQPIVAEIKKLVGELSIRSFYEAEAVEGFEGLAIKQGDQLKLGDASRALIELNDGSRLWLDEGAELKIQDASGSRLALDAGRALATIRPRLEQLVLQTRAAQATVLGTVFELAVTAQETTLLRVLRGAVQFKNEIAEVVVKGGCQVEASRFGEATVVDIPRRFRLPRWACEGGLEGEAGCKGGRLRLPLVWGAAAAVCLAIGLIAWIGVTRYQYAPATYTPPQHLSLETGASLPAFSMAWPVGSTFNHRLTIEYETLVNQPGGGEATRQGLKLEQDVRLSVEKRTLDQGREVAIRFENVRAELIAGGQRMIYLADQPEATDSDQPLAALVQAQTATPMRFRIDTEGNAELIGGFDAFQQTLITQSPAAETSPLLGKIDRHHFERIIELFAIQNPPDRPIDVGDHWDRIQAGEGGQGHLRSDYRMQGWDLYRGHRTAVIELGRQSEQVWMSNQAITRRGPGDGRLSGQLWVDPAIGMVVKASLQSETDIVTRDEEAGDLQPGVLGVRRQTIFSRLIGIETADTQE